MRVLSSQRLIATICIVTGGDNRPDSSATPNARRRTRRRSYAPVSHTEIAIARVLSPIRHWTADNAGWQHERDDNRVGAGTYILVLKLLSSCIVAKALGARSLGNLLGKHDALRCYVGSILFLESCLQYSNQLLAQSSKLKSQSLEI